MGCLESDIKKLLPDDERPRSVESSGGRLLGDSIIEQQQQKAKPIKVSRERGDQSSRNSVASFNNDHSVLIEFLKNQTNYTSYFGLIGTGVIKSSYSLILYLRSAEILPLITGARL